MSLGSPVIPTRIPVDLLAQIDAIVARSATSRTAGQWTRSGWIVQAIRDKLAHAERSRKSRPRKSTLETVQTVQIL